MNKKEAGAILEQHLARYEQRGHEALARMADTGQVDAFEVAGPTSTVYQIEVECVWDDEPGGVVRIVASIDDGGLRAFIPLTLCALVGPQGDCRASA